MASPSEKLAQSLEILHGLQNANGAAIRAKDMTRTHRERLLTNGFLQEVIKGWYIPSRPDEVIGIGGRVAPPPLPHHRTCGSASGGSAD
jgi:hypothetical protein